MKNFASSVFVWAEEAGTTRNGFVSFEHRITKQDNAPLPLHLFADTRFRLWVNEKFVAYGPARFVTQFPEYDTYDLAAFLQEGENLVRVEVNYYGSSSYQTMLDGKPGFIAAGGSKDGGIDFSTPGTWQARHHKAWPWNAPNFSFAQNSAEICDTRVLAEELADEDCLVPVVPVKASEHPWGAITARSVPYPDYATRRPVELTVVAPLDGKRQLFGVQSFVPGYKRDDTSDTYTRIITTWIRSEMAQTIEIDCFWADIFLNGRALEICTESALGNHGTATLSLNAGWNLLVVKFDVLQEAWSYLIGLPRDAGLALHALPDESCRDAFAVSPLSAIKPIFTDIHVSPDAFALPTGWALESGSIESITPARVMAWDRPDKTLSQHDISFDQFSQVNTIEAEQATWGFDFKLEYYGHLVVDVEAPAGSILDIGYDDWTRDDGSVNMYGSNPFTDAADRFILKGGRQQIEVLNPRGGIYLQLTLRTPQRHGAATLKLHDVAIRRRTTITEREVEGTITTGHADFDWAWNRALNTLMASTDDAYSDCPWRERGSYIGDAVVGLNLDTRVMSDLRVARRTFKNFGRAAHADGHLPSAAPACMKNTHDDFTYLWLIGVRNYWALTGDVAFLEENWSVVQKIWKIDWDCHESGLWTVKDLNLYIDWGTIRSELEGEAHGAINILRVGTLRISAQMARALGKTTEAEAFDAEAEKVEAALIQHLWLEDEGRFAPSLHSRTRAIQTNVWAFCFGVGPRERLIEYLEPYLRDNLKNGLKNGGAGGHIELYFLSYILPALADFGRHDLAEQLVEDHYGYLRTLGYLTLNEFFCAADKQQGSCCHTWASAGAIYTHRYVLGLRPIESGNPDKWILDPKATDRFEKVEGTCAHPKGPIKVSWQRDGEMIVAELTAPEGVYIELGEGVVLRTLSAV